MDILVLVGLHNIGKTPTVDLVYKMVLADGGKSTGRVNDSEHPGDFYDVVNYKNKKIAFYSLGDYSTFLADAIYYYANEKCDVLICACSTNRPMVKAKAALNNYNTTRIKKTIAPSKSGEEAINNADALTIFKMI